MQLFISSSTERSSVFFTQFPLMVISCKTIVQDLNQDFDIDTVEVQGISITRIPLYCPFIATPASLPPFLPQLLTTTNCVSISILSSQECYINGIVQYVTQWDWLFSLSIIPWRLIHVVVCICNLLLFAAEQCSKMWLYQQVQFNLYLLDVHPCCSQVLATMDKAACEHLCTGGCVEISFHFSGINVWECYRQIVEQLHIQFKNPLNCFAAEL